MEGVFNQSIFMFLHGDAKMYFLVYINDLVITSSSLKFISIVVEELQEFLIKDLGKLQYFLGIHVT